MKRHVIILLSLVALLCGCNSADDTVVTVRGEGSIGFAVETAGMTRTATAFPTDKTFRVYAWNQTASSWLMKAGDESDANSNLVSYSTTQGLWCPKLEYQWPDDADTSVDFYAVCPEDVPFSTASSTIDYTTAGIGGTVDVLYCKTSSSQNGATCVSSNTYAAGILFQHALCRIAFDKEEFNGVTLNVNSITLGSIKYKGTFNFASAAWTADSPASLTDGYATTLDGALLLMPQTLADDAQIVVEYKILASDNVTYIRGGATTWATKTIPLSGDWLTGRSYTYTLTANQDIQLSCTIADWTLGTGGSDDFEI